MTVVMRRKTWGGMDDYSMVYHDADGRELTVGCIFKNHGLAGDERPWLWSIEHRQRSGRAEPHHGQVDTLEEARAAWRKCWESAKVEINWPPRHPALTRVASS
jgi:hypothetical protein